MLFSELENLAEGRLKARRIIKDREVTPKEIEEEIFFPLFNKKTSLRDGILFEDGKIEFIYIEFDNIDFDNETTLDPIKKELTLKPIARYKVYSNTKEYKHKYLYTKNININPTIVLDNENFYYSKEDNTLRMINENTIGKEQRVKATMSYFFKCKRYVTSKEFVYPKVTIGEWEQVDEDVKKIYFDKSILSSNISNKGGNVHLKIYATIVKDYVKEDNFGHIVERNTQECTNEDITHKCTLSLLSGISNGFAINGTNLFAKEQKPNTESRSCVIEADYKGIKTRGTFTQDGGDKIIIVKNIEFFDGAKTKLLECKSKESTFTIGFNATEKEIINGKIEKETPINDFNCKSNCDWVTIEKSDENRITLNISANHKESPRMGMAEISIDANNIIVIQVKQEECHIDHYEYKIAAECKDDLVSFNPKKIAFYEDGRIVESDIDKEDSFIVKYDCDPLIKKAIESLNLIRVGNYSYQVKYSLKTHLNSLRLKVWGIIIDTNENEIAKSNDTFVEIPQKEYIDSHLVVKLTSKDSIGNYHTNGNPVLVIEGIGTFKMQIGWIYEESNEDIMLNYNIKLEKNKLYKYNINNILIYKDNNIIDINNVILNGFIKSEKDIIIKIELGNNT